MENIEKVKTNWNILDKIIAKFRYMQVDRYVVENGNIVDIGCGQEGKFLLRHKRKIKNGYGFDYKIHNYKVDNIQFINNEKNEKIELLPNSIDVVFLNAVLEHLQKPKEVLSEATNVLKKGGKIVMTTPTPFSKPILECMAYKLKMINEAEIREHVHYYSKRDIEDLIEELNKKYNLKLFKYKKFEFGLNSLIVIEKVK